MRLNELLVDVLAGRVIVFVQIGVVLERIDLIFLCSLKSCASLIGLEVEVFYLLIERQLKVYFPQLDQVAQ